LIREILTLLTILLLEIAKTGFTDKDICSGLFLTMITFAPTSVTAILKRQHVSWGFSDGCVYHICSKSAKFGSNYFAAGNDVIFCHLVKRHFFAGGSAEQLSAPQFCHNNSQKFTFGDWPDVE